MKGALKKPQAYLALDRLSPGKLSSNAFGQRSPNSSGSGGMLKNHNYFLQSPNAGQSFYADKDASPDSAGRGKIYMANYEDRNDRMKSLQSPSILTNQVSPSFAVTGESKMLEGRYSRVSPNLMKELAKNHRKREAPSAIRTNSNESKFIDSGNSPMIK